MLTAALSFSIWGCQSPARHLRHVDDVAASIIEEKQIEALGHAEPFSIEPAAQTLRRRLLLDQKLPFADPASMGSHFLKKIKGWPDLGDEKSGEGELLELPPWEKSTPLHLSLIDALQVAARSSREYQSAKEDVFRNALALDLERDAFRSTFAGMLESELSTDRSVDPKISGVENSVATSVSRTFKTGVAIAAQIGIDLVKLLTLDRSSSFGIFADTSVSIPLLRGAGREIVSEPLTQAERETVYSIWAFERFKRTFAVRIASEYLAVLQQMDQVRNAEENYRSLISSGRRARRLADAGRLPEIQVDQAVQDELRARDSWIRARQTYESRLDSFKVSLGLPPDARIELDRGELEKLALSAKEMLLKGGETEEKPTDDKGVKTAGQTVSENAEPLQEKLKIFYGVKVKSAFDEGRLEVVKNTLRASGYPFFVRPDSTSKRKQILYVGPFFDLEEAQKSAAFLSWQVRHECVVETLSEKLPPLDEKEGQKIDPTPVYGQNEEAAPEFDDTKKSADIKKRGIPADAPVVLEEPGVEGAGSYELDPLKAIRLGFENRLDLRIAQGRVYDAQRAVVVAADALRAELNLLGSGSAGERRTLASADSPDAKLRPEKGNYSALLTLDLPWERTSEGVAFRNSFVDLEQAVRNQQGLEDQFKLDIRDDLRNLVEFREGLKIQAQAVKVAKRRVESTDLFLRAGRAQIRDLLEAQDALVSAQNALTSALVNYRIAELEIQRDMGLLKVDEKGFWREFSPEENNHGN